MLYPIKPHYVVEITERDVVVRSYRTGKGRELKLTVNSKGYQNVPRHLVDPGKAGVTPLSRLVALLTLGPCPAGAVVTHKDTDKLNNHPSNLKYVTRQESNLRAYETWANPCGTGSKLHWRHQLKLK